MADEITVLKVRTGSANVVMAGNAVNQTLTITNRSDYVLTNIYVKDTFSEGVTFRANSVAVDGTSYAGYNPTTGFTLPVSINAQSSATITYTAVIGDTPPESMSIYSTISFTANGETYEGQRSNTYTMELASGKVNVIKTNNKSAVIRGDTLTYQIVVDNVGTANQTAARFTDILPSTVQFVNGSVKIDGVSYPNYNPNTGFSLGNLYSKSKVTITFDVEVS